MIRLAVAGLRRWQPGARFLLFEPSNHLTSLPVDRSEEVLGGENGGLSSRAFLLTKCPGKSLAKNLVA